MKTMTEKQSQQEQAHLDYVAERNAKQAKEIEDKKIIREYANHYGWSDVTPYEVIKTISAQTVEVRELRAVQTVFPKEWVSGGFAGHCVDNHNQKYEYHQEPGNPIKRIRWSKAKNNWYYHGMKFLMEDNPYKHYDYNF